MQDSFAELRRQQTMNESQAEPSASEWQPEPSASGYEAPMEGLEYEQVYDYPRDLAYEPPREHTYLHHPQLQHHTHQHPHIAPAHASLGPQRASQPHPTPYPAIHAHHHTVAMTTNTPTQPHVTTHPPFQPPNLSPTPVQHLAMSHAPVPHLGAPVDHSRGPYPAQSSKPPGLWDRVLRGWWWNNGW